MAWTIVGTPQTATGTGPTVTVTKPTGVASGDLLLLFVDSESATGAASATGFTSIGDKAASSFRVTALRKVAGGSEPASYSVTIGAGGSFIEVALIAIRGENTTTPIDVSASNTTTGTTACSVGPMTTTGADLLVYFLADFNGGESLTVPSGFTSQLNDTADGLFIATLAQGSAGSTGTVTGTLSTNDTCVEWLIGVAPAGGGTVSGTANVQANAAMGATVQMVAAATVQANAALSVVAQVVSPAKVASNAAIAEAAQIVATAAIQANAVLAAAGSIIGFVEGSANVTANAAIAVAAQIVAPAALQANAVLSASGHIPLAAGYHSPVGSTARRAVGVPTGSTARRTVPTATTIKGTAPTATTSAE